MESCRRRMEKVGNRIEEIIKSWYKLDVDWNTISEGINEWGKNKEEMSAANEGWSIESKVEEKH